METWKATSEASRHRRQARDRFLARRRAKAEAAAGQQQEAGLPTTKQVLLPLPFLGANPAPPPASSSSGSRRVHFAADGSPEASAAAAVAEVDGGGAGSGISGTGGAGGSGAAAAGGSRTLSRMESLRIDAEYDAWVAYVIDRCCLWALFFSYNLAVLLIYVLQSGYVDLFG